MWMNIARAMKITVNMAIAAKSSRDVFAAPKLTPCADPILTPYLN